MGVTSEYSTRVSTRELRPYFYCPVRPLDANNIFPGGRANRPILFFLSLFPPPETATDPMQTRPMIYGRVRLVFRPRLFIGRRRRDSAENCKHFSRAVFRVQRFVTAPHRYGPSTGTYLFASRLVELLSSVFFSFSPSVSLPTSDGNH